MLQLRGSQAPEDFERAGIEVTRFDVTSDDPGILPDVDVVCLEIWDPAGPGLNWPINFYGDGVIKRA